MVEKESDKGFSVVDHRVGKEEEPVAYESSGSSSGGSKSSDVKPSAEGKSAAPDPARQTLESVGDNEGDVPAEDAYEGSMPQLSFPTFILSLHTSALIHLGLIPDPDSNQQMISLDLARRNIDLLKILKDKTKGNLTKDEEKLLDNVLYDLRMAYIQVAESSDKERKQ